MINKSFRQKASSRLEDYLGEFVYGSIDGTVTTFAVVAGATGAGFSNVIIIVLGLANVIADGFSMGVGSYLSSKSEDEVAQKKGERRQGSRMSPLINGIMTFSSFVVIGLVPLSIYIIDQMLSLDIQNIFIYATALTASAFIGIGFLKSYVAHTSKRRGVAETLLLGIVAAVLAYTLGDLLQQLITD